MASVSVRYAEALFNSVKKDEKEKYQKYLDNFSKAYNETELKEAIKSPRVDKETKLEIIKEIIPKNQVFINFIELLLNSNRLDIIGDISKKYTEMLDKLNNKIKIEITSAFEITKKEAEEIASKYQKKYKAKTSEYKLKIDESLIGGIKVEIDGKIYDDTLKTKLNEIL